jgi:ABC-type antimicrobial peptide transport system permease subunit
MILSEAGMLLAAGLAIGTFISLLVSRTAKALLFGMEPGDPLTIVVAVVCLAAVAVTASLLPARRAATLNPVEALREE